MANPFSPALTPITLAFNRPPPRRIWANGLIRLDSISVIRGPTRYVYIVLFSPATILEAVRAHINDGGETVVEGVCTDSLLPFKLKPRPAWAAFAANERIRSRYFDLRQPTRSTLGACRTYEGARERHDRDKQPDRPAPLDRTFVLVRYHVDLFGLRVHASGFTVEQRV